MSKCMQKNYQSSSMENQHRIPNSLLQIIDPIKAGTEMSPVNVWDLG